jgi:hypothetical protein
MQIDQIRPALPLARTADASQTIPVEPRG